jgi:hypothetical protein
VADPVTLTFALTRYEYAGGLRAEPARLVRLGVVLGSGLLATGVVAKTPGVALLGAMTIIAALALYLLPFWRWYVDPSLAKEETWTLADDGCIVRRPTAELRMAWAFYRELVETSRLYVLLGERNTADVIPKRVFARPEDEAAFAELVRSKVAVVARAPKLAGWTD